MSVLPLCINQYSIMERNQQISLMAFIFSLAAAVISWLGVPSGDGSSLRPDWDKGKARDRREAFNALLQLGQVED